jgi:diguanylate cyclase (GGDEF)-like protein
MKSLNLYNIKISNEIALEESQKVLDTILDYFIDDIFFKSSFLSSIMDFIFKLDVKKSFDVKVLIVENTLHVEIKSNQVHEIFTCKINQEKLEKESIDALKEKIIMLSKSELLSMIQNKNDLEKMLKEKLHTLNQELYESAYYDKLTKLPNRASFFDRYDECFSFSSRHDRKFALMFIDLDGFKFVNDTYGHDSGDVVLKTFANRTTKILREHDLLARLGGDEFVIIIKDFKDKKDLESIAKKIMKSTNEPIPLNEKNVANISASIGIVIFPDDSSDKEELLKFADISMYKVKESGKSNYVFFSPKFLVSNL